MDSSQYQSASKRPLDLLVAHALSELEKLRYSTRSLRRYRTVWEHLVRFAHEINLGDEYSEQLATRFVHAHRLQNGEHSKVNEEWRRHIPFLVTVLADFARDGRVERRDQQQAPPDRQHPDEALGLEVKASPWPRASRRSLFVLEGDQIESH